MNVHEAKTNLSRLLERVEAGEEVLIARRGQAVARLVPLRALPRQPGLLRGKVRIGKDFDDALPDAMQREFGQGSAR